MAGENSAVRLFALGVGTKDRGRGQQRLGRRLDAKCAESRTVEPIESFKQTLHRETGSPGDLVTRCHHTDQQVVGADAPFAPKAGAVLRGGQDRGTGVGRSM